MVATRSSLSPTVLLSQSGGDGHSSIDTRAPHAVPALLLLDILETHRKRQDLLRAELRLGNHIEAVYRRFTGLKQLERARLRKQASTGLGHHSADTPHRGAHPDDDSEGGDQLSRDIPVGGVPALAKFLADNAAAERWCAELFHGRDFYAAARKPYEKRLEKLAQELPVWPWVASVRGFGPLGLAQIVGECGDLHGYANPAKVWKRMGLAVIDGERQGKRTDPEEALAHGYSPHRRSLMYVISDSLIKGNREGEYRTYYLGEKERQRAKLPDAPQAHIHNRALRHTAKRLLRDLWRAWRAEPVMSSFQWMPDQDAEERAAD